MPNNHLHEVELVPNDYFMRFEELHFRSKCSRRKKKTGQSIFVWQSKLAQLPVEYILLGWRFSYSFICSYPVIRRIWCSNVNKSPFPIFNYVLTGMQKEK